MDREEIDLDDPLDDEATPELARGAIALRAVLSLLLAMILSVLNSLLAVVVIFQLVYTFVTQRLPSARVQKLGNHIIAYYYQTLRYLTHNDSQIPFPFSDFPTPHEAGRPAYAPVSEVRAADLDDDGEF